MHRFFVDTGRLILPKSNYYSKWGCQYISKVLRLNKKDIVEVCDGTNVEYICEIQSISKNNVLLSIIDKRQSTKEPPIKVVLYQEFLRE